MDVAHDTINSTQGPALIEVADSPSSEGKGQYFFRSSSGRVSWDLCRPSESNEGRRTIRFIKGHGSRPICLVNHQSRGGTTMVETPRPRFFCIVRGPAAAEQRGIVAPSPGAIPGPSSRRAGRAWIQTRPDSSLFELLPRTQTGRSQLSWTGQVRRDLRGTGGGVSIDLF